MVTESSEATFSRSILKTTAHRWMAWGLRNKNLRASHSKKSETILHKRKGILSVWPHCERYCCHPILKAGNGRFRKVKGLLQEQPVSSWGPRLAPPQQIRYLGMWYTPWGIRRLILEDYSLWPIKSGAPLVRWSLMAKGQDTPSRQHNAVWSRNEPLPWDQSSTSEGPITGILLSFFRVPGPSLS